MNLNSGYRLTNNQIANNQQPTTNSHSDNRQLTNDNQTAVLALPVLLFGLTYALIGFFYETNDDQIITLMLRGLSIRPALADLSIYFLGFSQLLAWLYAALPAAPWYGILLYGWLLVATMLAFWLLLRAFPNLKPWQRWGLLTGFYFFCWLEHVMWFNYMRVPLLLAGTSFLFLLRRQAGDRAFRWWPWLLSGALLLTALCIRPSAALLGLLVVGPAALLWGDTPARRGHRWVPPAFLLALTLAFFGWRHFHQTPAARQYQQLDLWKSAILDYGIYQPRIREPPDSLAFAAIRYWMLADQQVLNQQFYRQHGRIHLAYVLGQQAPDKLRALLAALGRDQFFILWLNGLLLGWLWAARAPGRRRLTAYGLYFWLLVLAIGIGLKLPPRVLTPCLSLYTLVQLSVWPRKGKVPLTKWYKLAFFVTIVAGMGYLAKVVHRSWLQQQRQQAHESFIAQVALASRGQVLVYSVLPEYFRSLSPFRNYDFGARVLFPLTGWSTLDPGYAAFYQRLTGRTSFVDAVLALSRQGNTCWLLEPGFDRFLDAYLQQFHGFSLHLVPQQGLLKQYPVQVFSPARARPE
jgi:hypothetical protein